tara:strand:- start:42 stop:200 length:159 start_codon:yes stop_codon:yes gene_type:complete
VVERVHQTLALVLPDDQDLINLGLQVQVEVELVHQNQVDVVAAQEVEVVVDR